MKLVLLVEFENMASEGGMTTMRIH